MLLGNISLLTNLIEKIHQINLGRYFKNNEWLCRLIKQPYFMMISKEYSDLSRITPQKQENRKNSLFKNNNNFSDGTKNFIALSLSLFLSLSLSPRKLLPSNQTFLA